MLSDEYRRWWERAGRLKDLSICWALPWDKPAICHFVDCASWLKEGNILERCFVTREQESLGGCAVSMLCSAVPQALARCFLPGVVNVLTQGPPRYTQETVLRVCTMSKGLWTKSKKITRTCLLRKQALGTVCCVYLEGPWVLWCSAGVCMTPHKRLGLRAKKPGSGLIYAELLEILAVLCVSKHFSLCPRSKLY